MLKAFTIGGLLLAVAACSNTAGKEDAPVGKRHEEAREVYVMSDDYPNLEVVCVGKTLVLVTTRAVPPVAIPGHEFCAEGDR